MMDMPVISIIIPVYKAEKYIQACVDSILNQTFSDFELILVEDGSPDSSGLICDQLAQNDKRIKVIHQNNQGPGAARNKGIEMASGKYLNFIDSDDLISPDYLESFIVEKDFDCIFQGFTELYADELQKKHFLQRNSTEQTSFSSIYYELFSSGLLGYTCIKQYRMDIIKKYNVRFDTSVRYREDLLFTVEYFSHCKTILLGENCGYYYRLDNSNSLLHTYFDIKEYIKVNKKIYNIIRLNEYQDNKFDEYICKWYFKVQYKGLKMLLRTSNSNIQSQNQCQSLIMELKGHQVKIIWNNMYSQNCLVNLVLRLLWRFGNIKIIYYILYLIYR